MNKNKYRLLLRILITSLISYIIISILISFIYGHKVRFGDCKKYEWLFNEEFRNQIDTLLCVGDYRDSDSYYTYNCEDYYVGIIEVKSMQGIQLSSIKFNSDENLDKVKFYPADLLNGKLTVIPAIRIRWRLPFENHLTVNFNEKTEVLERFKGDNYIGLYGNFNKMSFSNERGKHLMLFDYRGKREPTLLIFKKTNYGMYIIMVNSEKQFDVEAKKMFKLD